jgi:2,3-bisphosphoglycerate-dependent phosphoglycerate mutase
MITRVLCIRHGETDWNASGRWQGHAPVPLNATGLVQSAALGRYLAGHGPALAALYSSDLARAHQTAQAIAEAVGWAVQPDPRLREVDLGQWQGLTRAEAEAWDPAGYAAFRADYYRTPPPDGESRNDLKARVRAAFDAIADRHAGQTAALVSHGASLGMLIESLFGRIDRPTLTNTSITLVERAGPGAAWTLARVAWTPHLSDAPLGETW